MPPSKISSSSTLVNGPITLPLHKFSHCLVATMKSHMQWLHIAGQGDLYAVLDSVRRMDVSEQITEKRVLKIVYRGDLLEAVELERLRDLAQRESRLQNHNRQPEPDFSILSRPSQVKIAVRYLTPDGMIRKIQLSLVDKYGYHCLVSELSAYSLPIRNMDLDARPATTEPIRSQRSDQRINQQYSHATALNHRHIDQSRTYPRPGVTSQYFGANSHNPPASQNHIGAYHSPHASQEYIPSSQPGIDASQTQSYGASLPQERFTPLQHSWPPLETRPFSAPETQTQMPMVKNHIESESLAEILPPKRSLPWIKEPDPTSKSKKDEAKPQVEDGPKAKKAKKEAKPRKKATPKKKRTQTGQPTLSGSVRKSGTTARKVAPNIVSKDEQHLPLAGSAPVPALEIPRRESAKPWMDAVMIAQQEDSNITPNTPTPLPLTPAAFTGRSGLRSTPQRHLAKFTSPPVSSAERPQETDQQHLTMTGHADPAIERDQRTDQQPLAEIAGNAQPTSSRPEQISQGVQTTPEIGPEEVLSKVESWVREYRDVPPKQLKDELAKFAAAPEKEQDRIVEDWIIDAVQDENFVKLAKSMESCYKRIVLENAVQATSP